MHAYLSVCAWGLLEGQKTNEWNDKGYLVEGGRAYLGVGVRICSGARISSRYVLKYFFEFGVMNVSSICKVNKIKEQADPDLQVRRCSFLGTHWSGAVTKEPSSSKKRLATLQRSWLLLRPCRGKANPSRRKHSTGLRNDPCYIIPQRRLLPGP